MYKRGDVLRNDFEGGVKFLVLGSDEKYYRLLDYTFHTSFIERKEVEEKFVFDHSENLEKF